MFVQKLIIVTTLISCTHKNRYHHMKTVHVQTSVLLYKIIKQAFTK